MSDQNQSGAIRLQSSAIVTAALITTTGAVIASCIQAGWIGKPTAPKVAMSLESKPRVQATFTGAIEPLPEKQPAKAQPATATATLVNKVVAEQPPALLPMDEVALPRPSPWSYLQQPTASVPAAGQQKSTKKPIDWGSIARFFQGKN